MSTGCPLRSPAARLQASCSRGRPRPKENHMSHRVLTGDRPTGPLHLDHYFGTLEHPVRLQDRGDGLLVLVAAYQTLPDRGSPATLPRAAEGPLADYPAVGIDPDRATISAHSQVEALTQLLLPFLSVVSVAELSRNPTLKDERAASGL